MAAWHLIGGCALLALAACGSSDPVNRCVAAQMAAYEEAVAKYPEWSWSRKYNFPPALRAGDPKTGTEAKAIAEIACLRAARGR